MAALVHNGYMLVQISRRLAEYHPREVDSAGRARAAVLIPLYQRQGEFHVVLTKRTDRVQTHKGEISFPGGAMDATDRDLKTTALRESDEEIGLHREHVEIVGRVDDIITISDFHVTVFVGAIEAAASPYLWRPHEVEVAEVLEVPLTHLLDRRNLIEVPRLRDGRLVLQEGFGFGEHLIWGATARMLRNFLDVAVDAVDPAAAAPSAAAEGAGL